LPPTAALRAARRRLRRRLAPLRGAILLRAARAKNLYQYRKVASILHRRHRKYRPGRRFRFCCDGGWGWSGCMNTPWMCFAAGRRRGGGGRGVCQSVSQVHRGPPRRSPLHHTRTPSQRAAPLPWSKHRVLSILAHSEHRGDLLAPDVLHAGVKRDPTKFSNSRNAGPHSTFLAAAPRSDA